MPKDVSLSEGYTSDRCCFFQSGGLWSLNGMDEISIQPDMYQKNRFASYSNLYVKTLNLKIDRTNNSV